MRTSVGIVGFALALGGALACFTGDGLRGQPCRTDADCNPALDPFGRDMACVHEVCGAACGSDFEECNDGNEDDRDGCVDCRLATCGDGAVWEGQEECDDGNSIFTDGCVGCKLATCGDGFVWADVEDCEEGDPDCAGCQRAQCGDGEVNPLVEDCDDRNNDENDGCNSACEIGAERIVSGFAAQHTCALREQTLRCWGANSRGQLGVGHEASVGDEKSDLPPKDARITGKITAASAGNAHTCVLLADAGATPSNVRCWGSNMGGALGLPGINSNGNAEADALDIPVLVGGTAIDVSAGQRHTCAVLMGGAVRCWGTNQDGVLGQGPALADGEVIGDTEPPASLAPVALGGSAAAVSVGLACTCALLTSGAVRCWGSNGGHLLGLGDPSVVVGDDETPEQSPFVPLGGVEAEQIAAGGELACAVRIDGQVWCWGIDLPAPSPVELGSPSTRVAVGDGHACALVLVGGENRVRCWGRNEESQAGPGFGPLELGGPAVEIAAAERHTCALLVGGSVRCWGDNAHGELGRGHTRTIGDSPDDMPPAPSAIYQEP